MLLKTEIYEKIIEEVIIKDEELGIAFINPFYKGIVEEIVGIFGEWPEVWQEIDRVLDLWCIQYNLRNDVRRRNSLNEVQAVTHVTDKEVEVLSKYFDYLKTEAKPKQKSTMSDIIKESITNA